MATRRRSQPDTSEATVSSLFNHDRFPKGWQLLALCIYSPVGVLLTLLRIFLGIHAFVVACLLPKQSRIRRFVLRCLCTMLGIIVKNDERCAKRSTQSPPRVIAANHVSPLDHLAVDLVQPCLLPCVWDLPEPLMWLLGFADLGARQGRSVLIENAKVFCSDESSLSLLAFPEGAITSGRRGTLLFSSWPFSLDQPVQPLFISISRPPVANIAPGTLGSRWWTDLLWFLFVPYSYFKLSWLPLAMKIESETADEFAWRIQTVISNEMGLTASRFTSHDAVEYAKQVLVERNRNKEFEQQRDYMVKQVKAVMPQVPVAVIKADLDKTRSANVTISNFLEGRIAYVPEAMPASSSSPANKNAQAKKQAAANSGQGNKNNGSYYGNLRQTLEQRKREMIMESRQKYLARKGD